jgi:hypothetical protein
MAKQLDKEAKIKVRRPAECLLFALSQPMMEERRTESKILSKAEERLILCSILRL